ncbi:uroporphyrinogen-III synthase [Kangiella marina]|uniref:Uroporphyrinogen-III synthase n=1 Tax=Kangiella marina TaxID=1079178 RepID=A0ABP8IJ55_9GAMM
MVSTQLKIVVTRPSPFGEALCSELEPENFFCIHCPLIDFQPDSSYDKDQRLILLKQSQTWIFISRQAVNFCFEVFSEAEQASLHQLSADKKIIAVGSATADALAQLGIEAMVPTTPNSEGIIALLGQHQLATQATLLIRGNQGRALLQEYFSEGHLSILPVYQRHTTQHRLQPVDQATAIVVTSGQLMELVAQQITEQQQRRDVTIISGSQRISQIAQQFGFTNCYTAENASNTALVKSCILWRNSVT